MKQRIEPIIFLLAGLLVFFAITAVGVAKFMPMDGQTFTLISGLVTAFSGALMMRVKPRADHSDDPPPEGTTTKAKTIQQTETETVVPPKAPQA